MRIILVGLYLFMASNVLSLNAHNQLDLDSFEPINPENVGKLTVVQHFDFAKSITEIAWFPDQHDKLLVSTTEALYSVDRPSQGTDELLEGYMQSLRFIDDTSQIAMWDQSELVITVYDLERSIPVKNIFVLGTTTINDTGTLYASGGIDSVEAYDLQTSQLVRKFAVTQYSPCDYACPIHGLSFTPNSDALVFASTVPEVESAMGSLDTGDKTTPFEVGAYDLTFNNDGYLLVSASGEPGYLPDKLLLTDTFTGKAIIKLDVYVSAIGFSSNGNILAVGMYDDNAPNPDVADGLIDFFNVQALLADKNVEPLLTLNTAYPPSAIKFSDDDRLIAIGDDNGNLSLWGVLNAE